MTKSQPGYAVEIEGLSKTYRLRSGFGKSQILKANDNISFNVLNGEVLGIVGESGSGKTTLAKMLLGLERPSSGTIKLYGAELGKLNVREIARKVQFIFQDPYSSLNPQRPIDEAVAYPLYIQGIGTNASRLEKAHELLNLTGIPERSFKSFPSQLSGGQRQRVVIARALILNPSLLICDEPTSALDVSVQAQILNLLTDLRDKFGLSMIFISHNLEVVKYFTDRIVVMKHGVIVEQGNSRQIFQKPQNEYTKKLIASIMPVKTKFRIN